MRLTLRTLLAYLDDTLDPVQAKQIGEKVAESGVATDIIERIRKVTRKRSLGVPHAGGPDGTDANTIAEYLDNDLTPEKLEEVEIQALQSEIHLAEIAACHQLLTLILSEPAQVPPTARQRMYGLAKGPEVDPNRRAPRVASLTLSPEVGLPDEGDTSPLISRRSARARLTAAGILLAALIIVVAVALTRPANPGPPVLPESNAFVANVPKVEPKKAEPPSAVKEEDKSKEKEPEKAKEPEKSKEMEKSKEPEKEAAPPPPPAPTIDLVAERRTSDDRKEVGKLLTAGNVMFASVHQGAPWTHVAANGAVTGISQLMCLPGTQAEMRLGDAVKLELWGAATETLVPLPSLPVFESAAIVFAPPDAFNADVRLVSGRAYLKAARLDGARVRLRLGDDLFDITFEDDQSEVVAEKFNQPRKGESGPMTVVAGILAVRHGKVSVRQNMQTALPMSEAPGSNLLVWTPGSTNSVNESTARWSHQPPLNKYAIEKRNDLDALTKRVIKKLAEPKDITLAVKELATDPSPWAKAISIYCLAALDELPTLLDAVDDNPNEARTAAAYALHHWLGQDASRAAKLRDALKAQKGFNDFQVESALTMLLGFTAEELRMPATYASTIDLLKSDRLALRELAARQLRVLDPEGAEVIRFQATDQNRDRAVQEWKRRIPEGTVPGKKT